MGFNSSINTLLRAGKYGFEIDGRVRLSAGQLYPLIPSIFGRRYNERWQKYHPLRADRAEKRIDAQI